MEFKMIAFISLASILVSSCVSQKKVKMLQEKTVEDPSAGFVNSRQTTYHLQPGDQLYIKVFSTDPKTARLFQSDFPNHMSDVYQNLNFCRVSEDGGREKFCFFEPGPQFRSISEKSGPIKFRFKKTHPHERDAGKNQGWIKQLLEWSCRN